MGQVQLFVTLGLDGELAVELPGASGTRRRVSLPVDTVLAIDSMKRMLRAQQGGQRGIASAAEPTQWEIDRWTAVAEGISRYSTAKPGQPGVKLPSSPDEIGL